MRAVVAWAPLNAERHHQREEDEAHHTMEAASALPGVGSGASFDAARRALLRPHECNRIGDEAMVALLRETDLVARAIEETALPGAGSPSP